MTTEREEALELAREAGVMPDALSGHYIATEDVLIRIVRLAKQRGAEERKQHDLDVCRQHYSIEGIAQGIAKAIEEQP